MKEKMTFKSHTQKNKNQNGHEVFQDFKSLIYSPICKTLRNKMLNVTL